MHINLSKLMSVKGDINQTEVSLERKCLLLKGESYDMQQKEPIRLTFTFLGDKKLRMEGTAKVSLKIPCGRCLSDVEYSFDLSISKELDLEETKEDRIRDLDETNYVEGYNLDVDQLICNEIVIRFPMKVLCSESCKGICTICGKNLNSQTCGCDNFVGDPRMSVIRDIFNNFKEV